MTKMDYTWVQSIGQKDYKVGLIPVISWILNHKFRAFSERIKVKCVLTTKLGNLGYHVMSFEEFRAFLLPKHIENMDFFEIFLDREKMKKEPGS